MCSDQTVRRLAAEDFPVLRSATKSNETFLALVEAIHPGAFDGADVDEYVLAAVIRLDEAVAFLAVEPLYGSLRHVILLSKCVYERSRF
jgi:hypothetical protein